MEENLHIDQRMKRILEFIEPKKTDKILVIGTGVYPSIEEILHKKFEINSITSGDIDKKNIENAKKILPKLNFIYLDAQKRLLFETGVFDKVIFTEVLEHLKDENLVLREIKRVLKKGGRLILSVPKRRWFNLFNPITYVQHLREYDEKRIRKILEENGFEIKNKFTGGNVFDLFNLWIHLVYKHIFKVVHRESFFKEIFENSYKKDFKGKGIDIILKAKKRI